MMQNIPEPPPLAPMDKEIPLDNELVLKIELIKYKELAARQSIKLASIEIGECNIMKKEAVEDAISKYSIDTNIYTVMLDSEKRVLKVVLK